MDKPRNRILNTVKVLFHKQGYSNTGINQIIEEANVSKASFYTNFKSKDDLCIEFLNQRFDYWVSEFENFRKGTTSLREKILKSFDFLMYMNEKEDFRGCSFLNLLSEVPADKAEIHASILDHKRRLRDSFSNEIDDEILSAHIYLLFESCIITSQLYRSNELIERSKIILHDIIK
ncbi:MULTISPECIES: TetR/AcrR family transcriptional regulator [Chryseobacterium]|uniref:TetR/AcrR family transcriptional regulator n=1 Tax=Chryseobacterium TaxID=59732 RepID=UPI0019589A3B|nr:MULTISPECIES: TetR/AcrR family transcriptional regulator [Chryseobacterium]MBM7420241.1 AcrR family transcriptional regulator [Chryseobacterium sp. JUb44]MDH6210184.1 AcrR family transcriptional regulator [Chryseobacterium sp. BIGb0186]WSO08904.1 TetR/AcrR family transcriptional regulator [Chryseobacterium scophthalmum]